MAKKKPFLQDYLLLLAMGIDPLSKDAVKYFNRRSLKPDIKASLRIVDEQDAINRFEYKGLPKGLSSQIIERILYYRGRLILFKIQDQFYTLPFALQGNLDVYGRAIEVTPVIFGGTNRTSNEGEEKPWITGLVRKPIYETFDSVPDNSEDFCIILNDYSPQISQNIIPRAQMSEAWLDFESDMIPFCRTALLNGTGISGVRVASDDESDDIKAASISLNTAALCGDKWIPIIGNIDFQSLTEGSMARAEDFLMAMQAVDNLRLSTHGLTNSGVFQKKSHMLQDELNMNEAKCGLIMKDCLENRKLFCELANSCFGLNISVEQVKTDDAEDEIAVDENKTEDVDITESDEQEGEVNE